MIVHGNSNGYQEKLYTGKLEGCLAGGKKGIPREGSIMNMSGIYELSMGWGREWWKVKVYSYVGRNLDFIVKAIEVCPLL